MLYILIISSHSQVGSKGFHTHNNSNMDQRRNKKYLVLFFVWNSLRQREIPSPQEKLERRGSDNPSQIWYCYIVFKRNGQYFIPDITIYFYLQQCSVCMYVMHFHLFLLKKIYWNHQKCRKSFSARLRRRRRGW